MSDFPLEPGDEVSIKWLRDTFPDAIFIGFPDDEQEDDDERADAL